MTLPNTFVFVLALVVAGNVVLGWIIYDLRRQHRALASSLDTTDKNSRLSLAKLANTTTEHSKRLVDLAASSPAALPVLGAQVAELAEAVERLRKTHQRFAGRVSEELWREAAPDNAPPTLDRDALRREHASAIMPAGLRK